MLEKVPPNSVIVLIEHDHWEKLTHCTAFPEPDDGELFNELQVYCRVMNENHIDSFHEVDRSDEPIEFFEKMAKWAERSLYYRPLFKTNEEPPAVTAVQAWIEEGKQ